MNGLHLQLKLPRLHAADFDATFSSAKDPSEAPAEKAEASAAIDKGESVGQTFRAARVLGYRYGSADHEHPCP